MLATLIGMATGFIWYSKYLFGNIWQKLMGFTPELMAENQQKMSRLYTLATVSSAVMAYVLAQFIVLKNPADLSEGVLVAVTAWLGFVAPVLLVTNVIFGGQSFKLFLINATYHLAALIGMSVVLTLLP